jgi:RimJ/RimL family protein N-acetyltransferase
MINAWENLMSGAPAEQAARFAALVPRLQTERLTLRAPHLSDFEAWIEVLCGASTTFMGGPFTRDEAYLEFVSAAGSWLLHGHGCWTVMLTTTRQVLGFVLINMEPGDLEPELGYLFLPAAEGQGYASEAARAARDYGRDVLKLPSLVSYVAPENHRSNALAKRLGASLDADMVDGSHVWRHWGRP